MNIKSVFSIIPSRNAIRSFAETAVLVGFIGAATCPSAMAMGRNDAPCTFGQDCAATVYYGACNNNRLCFWYNWF